MSDCDLKEKLIQHDSKFTVRKENERYELRSKENGLKNHNIRRERFHEKNIETENEQSLETPERGAYATLTRTQQ